MTETASHADILKAVNKCSHDISVVLMTVQRLQTQVENVVKCLGEEKEDERGQTFGTGLVGKHMRLESRVDKRFRSFDDWRNYAMGASAASVLLIAAVWWIIKVRVAELLQ